MKKSNFISTLLVCSCILVVLICGAFCQSVVAQTVTPVPYHFGFEEDEAEELANWHLNPGPMAKYSIDQWVVGTTVKHDGQYSLYISPDSGATATYSPYRYIQYAYRDFLLPDGQYLCTFDWMCVGDTIGTQLYAGAARRETLEPMNATVGSIAKLPNSVDWTNKVNGDNRSLYGSSRWKSSSFTLASNGRDYIRVFFAFVNNNTDTLITNRIGGCIDNIQITTRNCRRPDSIWARLDGDSVIVEWKGTSEQYSFEYRSYGRRRWSRINGIYDNRVVLENMDEGAYDFRIRGICNETDTSAYTSMNLFTVYYPDHHCIDYVHIRGNDNVEARYGFNDGEHEDYAIGILDEQTSDLLANSEKLRRHVVNWTPDKYDPRTGGQLKIIPDGKFASVRLGNWDVNAEQESLSYSYTVDAANEAILLVEYAIVMQDPGHSHDDQPRFKLEIIDEWGEKVDSLCGTADFYADMNREGWHKYVDTEGGNGIVTWKDWTTIGLNLSAFDGERLTVRFSTYDCALGGHWCYAYFTIDCVNAKITSNSCGDDAQMTLAPPDGFEYQWFNYLDQPVSDSLLSTDGKTLLVASSDTSTYHCVLTSKEEAQCQFTLYSQCLPRFPFPDFEWRSAPSNCQNKVYFTNKSHILTRFNGVEEHHEDEPCEDYDWTFGDGLYSSERNPVVIFPQEGGHLPVTLTAYIADMRCSQDTTFYIDVPTIGDYFLEMDSSICEGSYITFDKYFAGEEGQYVVDGKTQAGCDSLVILNVHLNPRDTVFFPDTTVCAEVPLCVDGECYKLHQSGVFVRTRLNQFGCDSMLFMNVTMKDSILPEIQVSDITYEYNSGEIHLGGTGYSTYYINDQQNGPTDNLTGGIYHLEFLNDFGCSQDTTVVINFECLGIQLGSQSFACTSDTEILLPLAVDSGIPSTYSLLFDNIAKAQGFSDITDALLPVGNLSIPIPAGVRAGRYNAVAVFKDLLCADVELPLVLEVNYPADIIFQRWNDVLSVKGTQQNGGYVFTAFQWYKGGEPIMGATKSYYSAEGGLDENAEYQVLLTDTTGVSMFTCGFTPQSADNISLSPSSVPKAGSVTVSTPNKALLSCYDATGLLIDRCTVHEGVSTWHAPQRGGVYMVSVGTDSELRTFRIIVSE